MRHCATCAGMAAGKELDAAKAHAAGDIVLTSAHGDVLRAAAVVVCAPPRIVAARLGASRLVLTDGTVEVLARAKSNAAANLRDVPWVAQQLLFGEVTPEELAGKFDVLIASARNVDVWFIGDLERSETFQFVISCFNSMERWIL